jgi:hypothetical protein
MRNPTKHTRFLSKLLTLIAVIALFSFWSKPASAQMHGGVSFQVFYDELMPYGTWVNDPRHGFVWLPNAGPNFHPYATNGHWVVTSYGNTWVSDFNWGWAPFHYGRWFFSNHYGWAWVPGYEWGPAWVNWRTGGGYYGWAPLGPGIHINMAVNIPHHHYVFVPQRRLVHRRMNRYFVARPHVMNVYQNTTIINNTVVHNQRTYIAGPNRGELQRVSRRNIPVHQVSNAGRPGRAAVSRGTVAMYRPEVNRNTLNQARPGRAVAPNEVNRNNSNRAATRQSSTAPQRQNTRQTEQRVTRSNENVQRNNARQQEVRTQQARPSSRVEAQPSQRPNQRQVQQGPAQRQERQVQQRPAQRQERQVQQGPAQRQERQVQSKPAQQQQRQVQQRPAQSQTRQAAPRQEVKSSAPKVNQSGQQAPARTSSPRVQSGSSSRSNSGTVRNSPSNRSSGGTASQPSSRGGNREGNSRGGGKRGNN